MTVHSDNVSFPKNTTAYIYGAATADWLQDVKIKVQSLDGTDESECTLQAYNNTPLVVTDGSLGFLNQNTVVIAAGDVDRNIEIVFKVYKDKQSAAGNTPSDINDYKKDSITPTNVSWVNIYTYCTDDGGGDSDFHDTTLVVTVVNDTK